MRSFAKACALAVLAATAAAGGPRAATAAPAPRANTLSIDYFFCYSLGHGRLECDYTISGGSGTVTTSWTPTPSFGGGATQTIAIIPCTPYTNRTVSLTVSDTNGGSDFASMTAYCGDAV